jgi:hypothetical protein
MYLGGDDFDDDDDDNNNNNNNNLKGTDVQGKMIGNGN